MTGRSNLAGTFTWNCVLVLSIIGCLSVGGRAGGAANDQSHCEYYSIPLTKGSWISDMVIDSGRLVWIMANSKVYYLSGREFREPVSGPLTSGNFIAGLYGGPDRGAYLTQKGQKEHEGLIYRLDDGAASLLSTFYYEVAHTPPGLYVSKFGTLFNWGERFLSRFNGETWHRIEARLSLELTVLFDMGRKVYFYYDNALYCADESGDLKEAKCPKWVKAIPGQNRITGALWAGHNALLVNYGQPGLFAFDLETGQEIGLSTIDSDSLKKPFYDVFSLRNGEVWILGPGKSSYNFYRLSPEALISVVPETEKLLWDNTRCWQFPESVLETSKGTLLFGMVEDGLALIHNGDFVRWGWEYGFAAGTRHLHEDLDGNVWFPMDGEITKLTLGRNPPPKSLAATDWEGIQLTRSDLWELESVQLAMFREDMPGKLSRWDGKEWEYQEVPFDIENVWTSVCDDRGHLLVAMREFRDGRYDISREAIEKYKNTDDMLVDAVKNGVRDFRWDKNFQGIVVTSDKRLWFGYANGDDVHMHDGVRWDSFRVSADLDGIFRSSRYGVIMGTRGRYRRYYYYDRGQIIEIDIPPSMRQYSMTNGERLQLYERELVDKFRDKYFIIMQEGERTWLFFNPDDFEALMDGYGVLEEYDNVELPKYFERLSPAPSGGAWVFSSSGSAQAGRVFGNRIIYLDVKGTPLGGKRINDIKEDAGGDMWFLAGREQPNLAYHYRLSSLKLDVGTVPKKCERRLECSVAVTPRRMAGGITFLSRLNAGQWTVQEDTEGSIALRFPNSGEYRCEISGIKLSGKIKNSASFDIVAEVSLPETVVTAVGGEPVLVDSIEWAPPVSIQKTRDDVSAALLWRTGGSVWRKVTQNGLIMADVEPGVHAIEFAAEEEGFWRDQSPASIKIRFEPALEKLINFYISELLADDNARRAHARKKLLELGEKGVPTIKKRLFEAERSGQIISELRRLLNTLSQPE